MLIEDPTGTAFMSSGLRTITFDADGSYSSDIFTNGGASVDGSFLVLATSVAVTFPNAPYAPFVQELASLSATGDSLKFVLDVRPTGTGFQSPGHTIYFLARQ